MLFEQIINLAVAIAGACVATLIFVKREQDHFIKVILIAGIVLRVVGSVGYFTLLETAYGHGDYTLYLSHGDRFVRNITDPTASPYSPGDYFGRWVGTPAVVTVTGSVMLLVGNDPIPVFIVFSVIGFIGCALFGVASKKSFPNIDNRAYYSWIMLYPSLWFWGSPVGKDGLVLLGIALTVLGMVGTRGRRNFLQIVCGIGLTVAIRPQYALILIASILGGSAIGLRDGSNLAKRVATVCVLLVGAGYALSTVSSILGFDVTNQQQLESWVEWRGEVSAYGGSGFETASNPLSGAFITLFRPLPWEAKGLLMLITSLEVVGLWILVVSRWRGIARFFRQYSRHELFWISSLFVLLLAGAIGMTVGNFGTIVRQRIHIYPLMFIIVSGVTAGVSSNRRRRLDPASYFA